jgi:DNA-binding XRE family transcriptional regulator
VNAIETGRMVPSVLLALRLAGALEVPVETIFRLDPDGHGRKETGEES